MADKRTQTELDVALAPFFEAARDEADAAAPIPDALMARILADAAEAQPRPMVDASPVVPKRGTGFASVLSALGGWPAAAGLAAVMGVGILVGYSPPDAIFDTASQLGWVSGDSPAAMLAGFDAAFLIDG